MSENKQLLSIMAAALVGIGLILVVSGLLVAPVALTEVLDNRLPDLIENVRPGVVHISKLGECQGSGCLISPDGILFTAKHVSDGRPGDYEVTLDGGRKFKVKPGYVLEDRENDITFMQLDLAGAEPNLPYAELATDNTLRVGSKVVIMGSSLGRDNFNSVSVGILSALERDLYSRNGWEQYKRYNWHVMLQSTSPAYPGNSGGPIFSMRGEVIGVLVAGQDPCLNFSVPVSRFAGTVDTVRDWFRLVRFNIVGEEEQETFDTAYEIQQLVNAVDRLSNAD